MKTNFLASFLIIFCLSANAQLKKLDFQLNGQPMIYIDSKTVYSFDDSHFYIIKDTATFQYSANKYKKDTINLIPNKNFSELIKFSDAENGIRIIKNDQFGDSIVVLKTTDGGRVWQVHQVLFCSKVDNVLDVAFKDFDHYLIATFNDLIFVKNGIANKLPIESNGWSQNIIYQENTFVCTSAGFIHYSKDGENWNSIVLKQEWLYPLKQQIVNNKLYLLNCELSCGYGASYLNVFDFTSKTLKTDSLGYFTIEMYVDKNENVFLSDRNNFKDFTLHLLINDSTFTKTSTINGVYSFRSYTSFAAEVLVMSDSSIYLFDNPDCNNIKMDDVALENNVYNFNIKVIDKIVPIHYPAVVAMDALNGDTVSHKFQSYYLSDEYSVEKLFKSLEIKKSTSDQIIVVLSELFKKQAYCVTKTNLKNFEKPTPTALPKEYLSEASLSIYPNPVQNVLQINSLEASLKLTILDELGHLQMQKNMNELNDKMDVSHLNAGVYTIMLNLLNGNTQKLRFVKL